MSERNVIQKILIFRFSSLGDIVMATPMIRVLRQKYPYAQIDMVVREDFLDLVKHNPHLDAKIVLNRKEGISGVFKLLKRLNREHYDVIYDAHRSLRTLFLMPFLRAEKKLYFDKMYIRRSFALTLKLRLLKHLPRTLVRYIEPLKEIGVTYDQKGPEVFFTEAEKESALSKSGLKKKGAMLVGIIPSAQWPGKRWPDMRFRELLQKLLNDSRFQFIVFGGKADSFCDEICKGLPEDRVLNAKGKLTIAECAALINDCSFVIANDTGLMHVADALNVPSLLFLGPTSKELGCLPYHPKAVVLEHDLWCRPCSKNGEAPCIRKERYCLTMTTTEMAYQATLQLASQVGPK